MQNHSTTSAAHVNCSWLIGKNASFSLDECEHVIIWLAFVSSAFAAMVAVLLYCMHRKFGRNHVKNKTENQLDSAYDHYVQLVNKQSQDIQLFHEIIATMGDENDLNVNFLEEKKQALQQRMPGLFSAPTVDLERQRLLVKVDEFSEIIANYPKIAAGMSVSEVEDIRLARNQYHNEVAIDLVEEICSSIQDLLAAAALEQDKVRFLV